MFLRSLRNIVFLEMRNSDPRLKAAIGNVLNQVDSDLEVEGYIPSSDVVETLEVLDKVIIELDSDFEIDSESNSPTETLRNQPEAGYTDLNESVSD